MISGTDGTVLDMSALLKIELKGDSVQIFDTKWEETTIATVGEFVRQAAREIRSVHTAGRPLHPGHGETFLYSLQTQEKKR